MENNQLAVSSSTAHQISPTRQASDVAGVCKDIVLRTAQNIQGRKYIRVEGWQSIANAYGCVASAKDVERTETGFRAIGQVRRMDTGIVIAEAEGFVGDDERTWNKRDEYAKRAMAQTRAISRACRSAFAFVVTYMDAGLKEPVIAWKRNGQPWMAYLSMCHYLGLRQKISRLETELKEATKKDG